MVGIRLRQLLMTVGAIAPYVCVRAMSAEPQTSHGTVSFAKVVAPLFKARCVSCHSGVAASGHLDLSTRAGILKGGAHGALFTGDIKGSLLMKRLDGSVPPQMPMGFPPFTIQEQKQIAQWVSGGMKFDSDGALRHWAYIAPTLPKVPKSGSGWVQNPVDAFILQRLLQVGLRPSTRAPKEALIRRVSLDLTGLPPTPAEVAAFVADQTPGAYERVVDRLLASPHYGERQAREWLDLARYADSDGYEKDLGRSSWLYRDWVIDAFNRNVPYDRFTVEQLAGDLIPNATLQDKIATGFQRNTMQNLEGGVDQEEAHFLVELDRAETTSAVWLGSTLNCARCHDHKYDPFTQRDYYKMVAFYNNTKIYPRGPKAVGEEKWLEAEIKAPDQTMSERLASLKTQIQSLQATRTRTLALHPERFSNWINSLREPVRWTTLDAASASADNGVSLTPQSDGSVLAEGANPVNASYHVTFSPPARAAIALRLEAIADPSLPGQGPGRADNGNFVLTHLQVVSGTQPTLCQVARADYSQEGFPAESCLNVNQSGWAVNGGQGRTHELVVRFAKPIDPALPLKVDLTCGSAYSRHTLGRFRISISSDPWALNTVVPQDLRLLAQNPAPSDVDTVRLKRYWTDSDPDSAEALAAIARLEGEKARLEANLPTAMVMEEKPGANPLSEFVRHRGEFMSKTERVFAGTPSILPPLPPGRADRLALAKWLVSRSNPLSARVQVNRMWELLFGRGIVETSEDFGTRGSRPSHPELLDWLACWFMNHGWNMKALNRLLVTSATYCQSSSATPALLAKDPENRLYARGARYRMEAEMIHDVALADGGILSPKVGGPSVYPYQPEGIWDSPYSGQVWNTSQGEDRFRRGIYTFWKRTAPYPSYVALDATSRESCTIRRIRTNTPLQALALLNDRLMLTAAQGLGRRMREKGTNVAACIGAGFSICTARRPTGAELQRLVLLEQKLEARYGRQQDEAKKLGGTARDAALTLVGNVLLNLDETITKS